MGGLEQARLVGVGAGETAFLVAEELALHQFGRNGAAVDRHERPGRTRALLVDGAGDQFLAHARFTQDVDGGLAAGDLGDGGAQGGHGLGVAQQAIGFRRRGRRLGPVGVVQFQRVPDQPAQHVDVHRLADEIEGAGLERLHRQVHAAEGGDHRHRGLRVVAGDLADQLDAVAIG